MNDKISTSKQGYTQLRMLEYRPVPGFSETYLFNKVGDHAGNDHKENCF